MTSGAAGVLFYNNTILTETAAGASANAHWRNNLILGSNSAPALFSVSTNTAYSSSDYNGFRPNAGAPVSFQWTVRPAAETRFGTLPEYVAATRQDQHSVLVDYDLFVNVPRLNARDMGTVQRLYTREDVDFRLKAGSAAVDKGIALANITDEFSGTAPDLGALEFGKPSPIYGPR
jgi:hypothetical protein